MMHAYTVRRATREDSRFIYGLAMDPRIRQVSTRAEEFEFADHEIWYGQKLASDRTVIWILEVGGLPVGQVRYGKTTDELGPAAEIAISVLPREWRKGYASTLLRETISLAREWLSVRKLVALVLRTNHASRSFFRQAGFRYIGPQWRLGKLHARYESG